jgi:hypothetical protein
VCYPELLGKEEGWFLAFVAQLVAGLLFDAIVASDLELIVDESVHLNAIVGEDVLLPLVQHAKVVAELITTFCVTKRDIDGRSECRATAAQVNARGVDAWRNDRVSAAVML